MDIHILPLLCFSTVRLLRENRFSRTTVSQNTHHDVTDHSVNIAARVKLRDIGDDEFGDCGRITVAVACAWYEMVSAVRSPVKVRIPDKRSCSPR